MSTHLFTLPSDYGYVLGSACVAAITLHVSGLLLAAKRAGTFSDDAVERFKFNHHAEITGVTYEKPDIPAQGYPDDGNGRIAKQLDYSNWLRYNWANRAFLNYTEQIVAFVLSILLLGITHPTWAFWSGLVIAFFRFVYFVGYAYTGPGVIMMIGEIPALLALLFNLVTFVVMLF